ncbi:hypothetical protein ABZ806_40270 [Spirillospora sp. NPDC047418]
MSQEDVLRRLEEVVAELRDDGWTVLVEPRAQALPSELGDLQPDFIATRATEVLVGEVASRTSVARERVNELARQVPRVRNARFVVYWLGDTAEEEPAVTAILKYVADASAVAVTSPPAGLLMAWSALEAAIARFAIGKALDERLRTPRQQLSALYSLGYVSESDHDRLIALWRTRSEIAHRAAMVKPSQSDIDFVLGIARRMATDRYVSVDQMVEWYLDNYKKLVAPSAEQAKSASQYKVEDLHQVLSTRFSGAAMLDIELAASLILEQADDSPRS